MEQTIQTQPTMITVSSKTVENLVDELRLLRNEISLLLPSEDLEGYTNSERIVQSYQNAMRQYPPASI